MILPCEIHQLDIPDQKSYSIIFLVPVRKNISVQEIYSDSLFVFILLCIKKKQKIKNKKNIHFVLQTICFDLSFASMYQGIVLV